MVYVDNESHGYGRMTMCHMVADSTGELIAMAERIGVHRRHIQYPGTPKEHFDICKSKRALAIKHGAVEITKRRLVYIIQAKTRNPQPVTRNPQPA